MAASASAAAAYVGELVLDWAVSAELSASTAVALEKAATWMASTAITVTATATVSSLLASNKEAAAPPVSSAALSAQAQARTHMMRSTVANRHLVFGRAMMSGPIAYATSNDNHGTLHLVLPLAHGESDAVEEVYFGDVALGPLDANGYPTSGRYYQQTQPGGNVVTHTTDSQLVNRTPPVSYQFHFVTLPQAPVTIAITDNGLDRADSPTGTPYKDGGGTWTNVGFDAVPAAMDKTYPSDPGPGYIPWRRFGVNGTVLKLSASCSNTDGITITYTTASGGSYYARVRKHLGAADQTADSMLMALGTGWTADHRLRGVSYIVTSMVYDRDRYPRGIPNVKALLKGRKLHDPRAAQYPNDTPAWSENPALVALAWLTSPLGFGCHPVNEIDLASFIQAANDCDEMVTINAQGAQQKRFTCNGAVDTGQRPTDALASILSSCAGTAVFTGGKWTLRVGKYAAPTGPTLTADLLRGTVKIDARVSYANLFNAIKGTFVDPARGWLPQDYPIQRNPAYVAADNGEEIVNDQPLSMTADIVMAQRLAKMALDRARQGIVVHWPGTIKLLTVAVGDTKAITLPHLGWTNKAFVVLKWSLSELGAIDLVLQEEAAASYDWNYGMATATDPAPDTALPDASLVPAPTGLLVESGGALLLVMEDGRVVPRLAASWDAPPAAVVRTEARLRRATEDTWRELNVVDHATIADAVVNGASYIVQVRHLNALGFASDWVTAEHSVSVVSTSTTAPPAPVVTRVSTDGCPIVRFTWTAAAGTLPIEHFEIRRGTLLETPDATFVTTLYEFEDRVTTTGTHRYWFASIPSAGGPGAWAFIDVTVGMPPVPAGLNYVTGWWPSTFAVNWPASSRREDHLAVEVHVSTSPGFTPSAATLAATMPITAGSGCNVGISSYKGANGLLRNLTPNATYRVRIGVISLLLSGAVIYSDEATVRPRTASALSRNAIGIKAN